MEDALSFLGLYIHILRGDFGLSEKKTWINVVDELYLQLPCFDEENNTVIFEAAD